MPDVGERIDVGARHGAVALIAVVRGVLARIHVRVVGSERQRALGDRAVEILGRRARRVERSAVAVRAIGGPPLVVAVLARDAGGAALEIASVAVAAVALDEREQGIGAMLVAGLVPGRVTAAVPPVVLVILAVTAHGAGVLRCVPAEASGIERHRAVHVVTRCRDGAGSADIRVAVGASDPIFPDMQRVQAREIGESGRGLVAVVAAQGRRPVVDHSRRLPVSVAIHAAGSRRERPASGDSGKVDLGLARRAVDRVARGQDVGRHLVARRAVVGRMAVDARVLGVRPETDLVLVGLVVEILGRQSFGVAVDAPVAERAVGTPVRMGGIGVTLVAADDLSPRQVGPVAVGARCFLEVRRDPMELGRVETLGVWAHARAPVTVVVALPAHRALGPVARRCVARVARLAIGVERRRQIGGVARVARRRRMAAVEREGSVLERRRLERRA